jgi:hypothetical protein
MRKGDTMEIYKVMGFELTSDQYIQLNTLAQKYYNWNSLTAEERQGIIKKDIIKIKEAQI